jgi:hypothetical protein
LGEGCGRPQCGCEEGECQKGAVHRMNLDWAAMTGKRYSPDW